jgi:DNA repair protein REV1
VAAATGCTASAGIGPNPLLARIATKHGKPDGQFRIPAEQARAFLSVRPSQP